MPSTKVAATLPPPQVPAVVEAPAADSQSAVKEVDEAVGQLSEEIAVQEAEDDDEDESVAVGAVAHVVRRAFHVFYREAPATPTTATLAEGAPTSDSGNGESSPAVVVGETVTDASQESVAEPPAPSPQAPKNLYVQLGEARKVQIESERQLKREAAAALLTFLDERHSAAHQVDDAIARELSDKGLVIKAQIPMGPTNLRLNAAEAARFGPFAADLVHAAQLVSEYHARRRERSGNGPDALVRQRAAAPGVISETLGYLEPTDSSAVRTHSTLAMHQYRIDAVKTHHSSSSSSKGPGSASTDSSTATNSHDSAGYGEQHASSSKDSIPQLSGLSSTSTDTLSKKQEKEEVKMTAVEKRKNMEILDRMQTKLAFLRNPRFAPSDDERRTSTLDSPTPTSCFVVVPSPVEFTDYDIGGVYEQLVYVRNTSHLSRRLRVLPPATIYFSIDEITFPDPSGLIAPGMHVQLRLRFAPDSRADYKDAMRVAHECASSSENGSGVAEFVIPLAARRTPPELSIPLVLRAQNTLVGSYSVTPLVCRNAGGKARFWLMTEDEWTRYESPSGAAALFLREQSESSLLAAAGRTGQLTVGAFTLSPNEMELDTGESVTFQLQYVPSCVGEQRSKFVMVCDNCLVRVFQIVGRGCQVELAVTSVNDKPVDASIVHMGTLDHVVFDAVAVSSRMQQHLVVTNDTPIALEYAWRIERVKTRRRTSAHDENETDGVGDDDAEPPYLISPSSGVIALNAALEFVVAFAPTRAQVHRWRAALFVNNIPQCSIPGPQQRVLLTNTFLSLQESLANVTLESVEALSVQLDGVGILGSFSIVPPYWNFCGSGDDQHSFLQKHNVYSTRVALCNTTNAPVAFEVDTANAKQRHSSPAPRTLPATTTATQQSSSSDESIPAFELTASPLTGQLLPNAQTTIDIAFVPHCVGEFSLALPVRIPVARTQVRSRGSCVRWLLLEGCVARGEVEIVSPEVDFGLVLVGTSAEATLTFRNRAPVPAEWRFLHVEAAGVGFEAARQQQQQQQLASGGGSGGGSASLQQLHLLSSTSQVQLQRKDSIVSRRSISSNASSGGSDTSRSSNFLFTARDTLPRATVSFAPETGTLAAGETRSIKVVCVAGSLPERLRTSFRCRLSPERSFSAEATSPLDGGASVSARAEIQSPNVFLSPSKLQLGTTYLGVAVRRTLQLVNVSNLEASFKFVEPQGLSKAYAVEFAPKSGTLRSKETLAVVLTYTPKQAGRTTVLLACTVHGLTAPLGIEVTTTQKGLVLSYELVSSAAATLLPKSPREIALERGISTADCDLEPETNPPSSVPKLLFGDVIPLGERSSLHILIRNFSGIEAVIDLEAKKFPASARVSSVVSASRSNNSSSSPSSTPPQSSMPSSPHSKTSKVCLGSSTSSLRKTKSSHLSTTSTRKKLLIGDAHEQPSRFQSKNGRDYMRQCAEDLEDREMLGEGHGVAFQLRPSHARIPPWEQIVVTVICFNNMPGSYTDDIVSRATGIPPVFLHAQATVVGTPLTFDRNCVGLSFPKKARHHHHQQLQEQPTFHFGQLCAKSPPLTRTLRVANRGPKQAKLKWKLVENGRENQLVNVSLRVDFSCRVQLRIAVCEEDDRAFPFSINPEQAMIPPFATVPFQITYTSSDVVAAARTLLLADAHWYDIVAPDKERQSSEQLEVAHADEDPALIDSRCEAPSSPPSNQSSVSREHPTRAAGKAFAAVRAANSLSRRSPAPGLPITSATPSHLSTKCLRVLLGADVIEPELFLDRSTSALSGDARSIQSSTAIVSASSPPSRIKSPYHIKFTTWSTIAANASEAAHAFHRQELFLVNHLSTRLTFRLESVGPFSVFRADSLAPKHPLSSADLPAAHRRAQGETFMFTLPPQMSVRIDLRFDPTQANAVAAQVGAGAHPSTVPNGVGGSANALPPTSSLPRKPHLQSLDLSKQQNQQQQQRQKRLKSLVDGQLLIKFTNRSVQTVQLLTEILRPLVLVSPSVHFFGHVHLSKSRSVVLRLANPTVVPAVFTVTHAPAPVPISKAQKQEFTLHHAQYVDEPSVFTFSATNGTVVGPTTSLKSSGGALPSTNSTRDLGANHLVFDPVCITVEFRAPAVRKRYKSRFRFVVAHGVDFEVVLEGEGHLGEREIEDQGRSIVRTRALEHSNQIFTKILQ